MNLPERRNSAPTVLLADDDELMRSLMVAALAEKGFEVFEVSDGQDAVAALGRLRPDLIVLDVDMPVMDGFTACEQIRASDIGRDIPVVIVTGNEDTVSIDRAFDVGATDFISKPVNWSLIGHRMRYVLRGAQIRAALVASEAENRAMLGALPDRLVLVSLDGEILSVIDGADQGEPRDTRGLQGQPIEQILCSTAADKARALITRVATDNQGQGFEYSLESEGSDTHYELRLLPQSEGVVLLILRDITARRKTEDQIRQLAYYDSLTGLANRHRFLLRSEDAVERARSNGESLVLCCLNLDHFKRINDTLGHAAGDNALKEIGTRLDAFRERVHATGTYVDVARLGSDEFVVLAHVMGPAAVPAFVVSLQAALSAPVACDRHQLVITASIGTSVTGQDGNDIDTLLQHADNAMAKAKQSGRNTHIAYAAEHEPGRNVLQLETDLRQALAADALVLHFQPKVDLRTGRLSGAEALLRWPHDEHGLIFPGDFIPLAEETGLIVDIDRWVADRACRQLETWQREGLETVPVSINLSGRAFCFDQPEITLQHALRDHAIEPDLLEIEITETVLMADPVSAGKTLRKLKAMGIRLAVDDFGTGYSSLGYLKHFPLDVLKIDRAFIADLEHDENDQALCRAMISMARGLNLEVVAEGIETEGQRAFLSAEGCHIGQGFLMSRPISADAFTALLASPPDQTVLDRLRRCG